MYDSCRELKDRIIRDTVDFEYSLALLQAELSIYIRDISDIKVDRMKDGIWKRYSQSKMSFLEKLEIHEFELFELQQKKPSDEKEEKALKQLKNSYEKLEKLLQESPNILNEEIAAFIFNNFIQERVKEAKEDLLDENQIMQFSEDTGLFIREYSRFLSLDNAATLIGSFSAIKNMIKKEDGDKDAVPERNEMETLEKINASLNEGVEKIIELRNINLELDNIYYKILHGLSSTLNLDMKENLDNMTDLKKRIDNSWTFVRDFKRTLVESILTIKEMDLEGNRDEMILDVLKKIKTGNQRRKRHSAVIKEKGQKLRELANKFSAHLISRMYELKKELQDAGFKGTVLNEAREVADISNCFLREFNEILKQSRVLYEKFTSYLVDFTDALPKDSVQDATGKDFTPSRWKTLQQDDNVKPASLTFLRAPAEGEEKRKSSLIFSAKAKMKGEEALREISKPGATGELGQKSADTTAILKKITGIEKEIRSLKEELQSFIESAGPRDIEEELLRELNGNVKKLLKQSAEGGEE